MRFQGFNGGIPSARGYCTRTTLSVLEGVEKEQDSGIEGLCRAIRGGHGYRFFLWKKINYGTG